MSETSQGKTSALPLASRMALAVDSRWERVRPTRTAVGPRPASLRAMAAPMPRPAPVMIATCPNKARPVSIKMRSPFLSGAFRRHGPKGPSAGAGICILNNNGEEDTEVACLRWERYL